MEFELWLLTHFSPVSHMYVTPVTRIFNQFLCVTFITERIFCKHVLNLRVFFTISVKSLKFEKKLPNLPALEIEIVLGQIYAFSKKNQN